MGMTSRLYDSDDDLPVLTDLVSATTDPTRANAWHVGDVVWAMYQNTVDDPFQNLRIWEDEAGVAQGFIWFYPRGGEALVCLRPPLRGDDAILDAMYAWATQRAMQTASSERAPVLHTQALDGDTALVAYLTAHGFTREESHYVHMRRDLDGEIPAPTPPDGWTVRQVGGEQEWQRRVDTHREVYHPSRVTLAAYRRLRRAPLYRPELDLVAVSPEREFASYCICWYDPVTRVGEFEPVGTRAAYRRRGLGRALMFEGQRRLRALGARTAIVYTNGDNIPAIPLYESAGFRIVDRDYLYQRPLPLPQGDPAP
ncbi:MAG TPA: N-acetyltransferase [Ktedonobacterales bacterium]|nr:N-acetyltransferase [Ktedonobacterales bacterium]